MNRNPSLKLTACSLAVLLLLSASPLAAQGRSTTTRVTARPPERPFYWWPAYRGMLPGLTEEQAAKLDGITASYGKLTRGLYMSMRAKALDRTQYSQRLRQLRGDIERAKRDVLQPAQLSELQRLETVWRMKMDAFRGVPNPYYAVQFTEQQLAEILSYRVEKYDPGVKELDRKSTTLADDFAKAAEPKERIAIIGKMADLENSRKAVQRELHEFVERLLKPDQLPAVRPRTLGGSSALRLKIDMQDWPPLRAITQIAESGGVKLEIEPSARKVLDTKDKTVNIRSSLVTPATAIEKVASAFGVRVSKRAGSLVLYVPSDGVSVVPSPAYGPGSIEVTPGTQSRMVRWRFGVREILPRYSDADLRKYLKSVSRTATIEVDKQTQTILVIMPQRDVDAVKAAVKALKP